MSYIVASYHCMEFQEKLMNQAKNIVSGPILAPFGPNINHQVFFTIQTLSVTKYYGQLSSCTLSEKRY